MPDNSKAPVDAVGGTQEAGPWPEHVDAIEEGGQYDREVELPDGSTEVRTVTVHEVNKLTPDRPDEEAGYAVRWTYDNTTGGGS
jgi:hypothetical protein